MAYCPNIDDLGHGFWTLKLGSLALESYYVDSMQGVTMGPTTFGNNTQILSNLQFHKIFCKPLTWDKKNL